VIGVDGLRVCDGSVMPTIPSANPNIPIMMIAERMSDLVLSPKPLAESNETAACRGGS